jgi:hypothetical protein
MRRAGATDHYGGPSLSEAALRAEVVKRAHAAGWKVFSLPIARTRRPVKDAVGYPDLTLARHGQVRFLELKAERGVLSEEQFAWGRALPNWYLVHSWDLNGMLAEVLK